MLRGHRSGSAPGSLPSGRRASLSCSTLAGSSSPLVTAAAPNARLAVRPRIPLGRPSAEDPTRDGDASRLRTRAWRDRAALRCGFGSWACLLEDRTRALGGNLGVASVVPKPQSPDGPKPFPAPSCGRDAERHRATKEDFATSAPTCENPHPERAEQGASKVTIGGPISSTTQSKLKGDDRQAAIYLGTVTVPEAARLLGVSKSAAYRAIAARLAGDLGVWPTKVVRIGRT